MQYDFQKHNITQTNQKTRFVFYVMQQNHTHTLEKIFIQECSFNIIFLNFIIMIYSYDKKNMYGYMLSRETS